MVTGLSVHDSSMPRTGYGLQMAEFCGRVETTGDPAADVEMLSVYRLTPLVMRRNVNMKKRQPVRNDPLFPGLYRFLRCFTVRLPGRPDTC